MSLLRSWAGPWRRRRSARSGDAPEPARGGPRIAVIGNCQAQGIVQSLRLILPDAQVAVIPTAFLARDHGTLRALRQHLDGVDHVFSQFFPDGYIAEGNVHALAQGDPRVRLFPTILFPAFHPDMIYLGGIGGPAGAGLVPSPVGPYHSAIALCGYLEGLSPAATVALFRDEVYARLGYHAAWTDASAYLLGSARDLHFGLEAELARWSRRGCFMHGLNHPKLFVLADLARRLATEAGLAPLAVPVEEYMPDTLAADVIWPVYPEIAARYGLSGSTLFKRKTREGAVPVLFDLPHFVAESFAIYARHPERDLVSTRVEAWRAEAGVRALFAEP